MDELQSIKKLKAICILDEFSYQCFQFECKLIPITPDNWKEIICIEKPDLLLVESAWQGNNGAWTDKIIHKIKEVVSLVKWCKNNNIPTVFWNKEDPFSFNQFIGTVKWFDIIFTTDVHSINKYKEILGHDQIYLLPFAAQPAIHNPIEIYEKREEKASFAGTNYVAKFSERQEDLERIFSVVEHYGLDIYDRYFENMDDQFAFPSKYQQYIRGTLKGKEIVRAYKGYKFSINLNSVKNSYTMFARRVFELIASNTIVISSYSQGMKELLNDLTVCSDHKEELEKKLKKLVVDNLYYKKYRLMGLREVLQYHTYRERFSVIVEKALNIKAPDKWQSVTMIGFANNSEEIKQIVEQFMQQTYKNKFLCVFCFFNYKDFKEGNISIYSIDNYKNEQVKDIVYSNYIGYLHSDDYYGENYLTDLMCASLYTCCDAFGKATYYKSDDSLILCNEGKEYRFVNQLLYRNTIITAKIIEKETVDDLYNAFNKGDFQSEKLFSIDSLNYLYNGNINPNREHVKMVLDLENINKGKKLDLIEKQVCQSNTVSMFTNDITLDLMKFRRVNDIKFKTNVNKSIFIQSELSQNENRYLYYNREPYNFERIPSTTDLNINSYDEYLISSYGYKELDSNVSIVIVTYSKDKKENAYFIPLNTTKVLNFESHIKKIIFCIRVQGKGDVEIHEISIKKRRKQVIQGSGSEYLVLTNIYPSYEKLYQNAFVHRRVKNYQVENFNVDVFVLSYYERNQLSKYEFDGVNVYKGYKDELRTLLKTGKYKKILVHFINPDMYEVLKDFLDEIKVIVWLHGSEAQPWYRRSFEYTQNSDLSHIKSSSDSRMAFIKGFMKNASTNIHFIFVSDTFRKEIQEDIAFQLQPSQYSIIHNLIDTNLFQYIYKKPEHRKKILSIGSFASRKYANDLKVKAILELCKKDFFNDLEFCIYGEGTLFEEIVAPIRQFDNVKIYNKFLTQNEIPKIHKEYGIFLVPTRCDSQGVSRDEAMASGLVPITTNISSIPEFVNGNCGMLVDNEDYKGLANAIEYLYYNPEEFIKKSKNAAEHVKKLSGKEATIDKEIKLIKDF